EGTISAVAGVGIAGGLISAMVWICAQVKSAITAIVAQAYGANRMERVSTLIPQMIYFNLIVGLGVLILTLTTSLWIFNTVFSAEGAILKDAVSYYNIRVIGFPLTLITFSIWGVFRGIK